MPTTSNQDVLFYINIISRELALFPLPLIPHVLFDVDEESSPDYGCCVPYVSGRTGYRKLASFYNVKK